MLDKLKKLGQTAKEKTGRGIEYAKGKASKGFVHPPAVDGYVVEFRMTREQIPKLYDRVASLAEHTKDQAEATKKLAEEYNVLGGHEHEHPEVEKYIRIFGDFAAHISENQYLLHGRLDEIKADFKQFESKDLPELKNIQDKVNHALADARYWRTHSNPSKLAEAESRYGQLATELVDMINRFKEKKETFLPQYIQNIASAQVQFYQIALELSEDAEAKLKQVGPVTPAPIIPLNTNFDVGTGGGDDGSQEPPRSTSNPSVNNPTPAPRQPAPASSGLLRVKGLYQFVAQSGEELSFNVGDVMNVVKAEGDWWTAEMNGKRGFIPSNYVQPI